MNNSSSSLRGQAVRIFLGAKGTQVREGVVLVDSGATVTVEYRTGGVHAARGLDHVCKRIARARVEVIAPTAHSLALAEVLS